MSERPLIFEGLDIRQFPGFEQGGFPDRELQGLGSGITIVWGPNASGKTSAVRAFRASLWPETVPDPDRTSLIARFTLGSDEWRVHLDGSRAVYQRNGEETTRPQIPGPEGGRRYLLSLHDLIRAEGANFARHAWREAMGGYDLEEAREAVGADRRIRQRTINEYQELTEADEAVQEARDLQRELKKQQAELPRLRDKREAAVQADNKAKLLEEVLEYRDVQERIGELESELEALPDGVSKGQPDDLDRIERANTQIREAENEIEKAREEIEETEDEVAELPLPEEGAEQEEIDTLRNWIDEWEESTDEFQTLEDEIEELKEQASEILGRIGIDDPDSFSPLSVEDVQQWEEFAHKAYRAREERAQIEAVRRWLTDEEEHEVDELEETRSEVEDGRRLLIRWIRDRQVGEEYLRIGGSWVIGGLVVLFVAVGAALVSPLWGAVVAIGALGLGIAKLVYERWGRGQRRDTRRDDYEALDLPPPESWTTEEVEAVLDDLYDRYGELTVTVERMRKWQAKQEDREEVRTLEREVVDTRDELIEELGAAPPTEGELTLVAFLKELLKYQRIRDEISGKRKRQDPVEERRDEARSEACQRFVSLGYEEPDAVPDARAALDEIRSDRATWKEAQTAIEQAEATIEQGELDIERAENELGEIYERLGLEVGNPSAVEEVVGSLNDFDELERELRSKRNREEELSSTIEAHSLFDGNLLDRGREELQAAKEEAEEKADRYEEIDEKIRNIESDIRSRREGHDLERALGAKDEALEALRDRREENISAIVRSVLLDHVRASIQEEHRPDVVEVASQRFAAFTNGRYELRMGENGEPYFYAYETSEHAGYGLNQLSHGTRVQLLMAVRLGFIEVQESGIQLPIFVDEALANTDDVRLPAVVDALGTLTQEGRQAFYLTCQLDEVEKVAGRLEDQGIEHTVARLTYEHEETVVTEPPRLDLTSTAPDPDGTPHEEYGSQIGVPAFDPLAQDIGEAHLWYLIHDSERLHGYLDEGIERLGQLWTLREIGPEMGPEGEEAVDRILEMGTVLEKAVGWYRRGRPTPISRQQLVESGAVSGNFIDEVSALLDELDGNPEALIEALRNREVDRFQRNKIEELTTYLEQEGYLDNREPLNFDELELRIRAEVGSRDRVTETEIERATELLFG